MSGVWSGGPIDQFREGWAIIPFYEKPHYWSRRELTREYRSHCGLSVSTHAGVGPLAPGGFLPTRCKICGRRHTVTVSGGQS